MLLPICASVVVFSRRGWGGGVESNDSIKALKAGYSICQSTV